MTTFNMRITRVMSILHELISLEAAPTKILMPKIVMRSQISDHVKHEDFFQFFSEVMHRFLGAPI